MSSTTLVAIDFRAWYMSTRPLIAIDFRAWLMSTTLIVEDLATLETTTQDIRATLLLIIIFIRGHRQCPRVVTVVPSERWV